jgi:hypothetical protein
MRFMVMHKVDAKMEAGEPPDQQIIEKMGALVGESIQSGTFLDGDGLHRSAQRVRVTSKGGARAVTRGPLQGGNELVTSCSTIKAKSMDDAIQYAERYAGAIGDCEIEIGPVVEAWDLGMMKKPNVEGARFLLLRKADAPSEAGTPPSAEQREALGQLDDELEQTGVLLKSAALAPSSQGARLPSGQGKRAWIDGPFAESKELIAGYSVIEVPSLAEAQAWADRYAAILGANEVDIRVVTELGPSKG